MVILITIGSIIIEGYSRDPQVVKIQRISEHGVLSLNKYMYTTQHWAGEVDTGFPPTNQEATSDW